MSDIDSNANIKYNTNNTSKINNKLDTKLDINKLHKINNNADIEYNTGDRNRTKQYNRYKA